MKKILVTGASGFIGQNLCRTLLKSDRSVIGVVRSFNSFLLKNNIKYVKINDLNLHTNWKNILKDVDCIIHCAAMAHMKVKSKKNSLKLYRSINVDGTKQLAEQAVKLGVRRLIFLSSIGVNKISTKNYYPNSNLPNSIKDYVISKYEAEKILMKTSKNTNLEVVIIRSPLVYGKSAPGNIKRLIKLINLGIPLPLDKIKNKRSFIGIDNLVNLLIHCIDHPKAGGKTFFASDDKDLSTPELIRLIASSLGIKARLFFVPIFLLKYIGLIFRRREEIDKLVGSLRVNNSYTKKVLNWKPPISVEEGIRRMTQEK